MTTFFGGLDSGWSESIHLTNDAGDITGITAKRDMYLSLRRAFLNIQYSVIGSRISDDATFRDIVVPRPAMPMAGQVDNDAVPGFNGILLRMQSGNRVFRNMFCRGITAVAISGRQLIALSGTAVNVGAFANFIKTGGFAISAKDPTLVPNLETAYDTVTHIHTVANPIAGLAPGIKLVLSKVKRSLVPQRLFEVATAPSSTTFTLIGWNPSISVANFGRWRNATPTLQAILDVRVGAVTERKVGRPFDLPRGRAAVIR